MLLTLMLALVPFVICFTLYLKQAHDQANAEAGQALIRAASDLAARLDEWVVQNLQTLQTTALIPDIVSMAPKHQEAVLKAVQQNLPERGLLYLADLNGLAIARSDGGPLENISARPYLKEIANGKERTWQIVLDKKTKEPLLTFAVPIPSNEKRAGLLVCTLSFKKVMQRVTAWRQGQTGFAFLVDENNQVLAHRNKEYLLQQKELGQHLLMASRKPDLPGVVSFKDAVGVPAIGFAQTTRCGWILVAQQNIDEIRAPALDSRTFFIFSAILFCMILAIGLSSFWFTRSLRNLVSLANRMSLGDLNVEIPEETKGEIGQLSQSLLRLQASLKFSIRALEHMEPPP
jgi:methyl-accepting chemotaxis protein